MIAKRLTFLATTVLAGLSIPSAGQAAFVVNFASFADKDFTTPNVSTSKVTASVTGGQALLKFESTTGTEEILFEQDFFNKDLPAGTDSTPRLGAFDSFVASGVTGVVHVVPPATNKPDGIPTDSTCAPGLSWCGTGDEFNGFNGAGNRIESGDSLTLIYAYTGLESDLQALFEHSQIAVHDQVCTDGKSCWAVTPIPAAAALFVPAIALLGGMSWLRRRREGDEAEGLRAA